MTTPDPAILESSTLFGLFNQVVPPQFFDEMQRQLGSPARGIYSLAVVVWLMLWQRLDTRGTLTVAVQQVTQGALGAILPLDKRVRERRVSGNTGAFSRARTRLQLKVVEAACDQIFTQLMHPREAVGLHHKLFLLDGSSLRLEHTEELVKAYPPTPNQHGHSHWPLLRVLVAHHLDSGLATRPCWGPMHGSQAVSEQGLAKEVIEKRLPPGSVLMADRNFAIFSVAWTAQQSSHQVLFRMTELRARKIAGKILPPINSELRLQWRPSREDRKKHPAIPPEAMIEGRLIVAQVTGEDGKPLVLYLFTTLEEPWRELVDLYGGRWFIETDIRTLKGTLGMQGLKAKTLEMVAKELLLGIAGYNLVRSVQMAAARQANLDPRRLSFSGVQAVVMTAVPRLATMTDPTEWAKEYQHVLRWAAQCKLPHRSHRRSYPRTVWGVGAKFPAHASPNPSSNPDQKANHIDSCCRSSENVVF